jgi:hypothetical protein
LEFNTAYGASPEKSKSRTGEIPTGDLGLLKGSVSMLPAGQKKVAPGRITFGEEVSCFNVLQKSAASKRAIVIYNRQLTRRSLPHRSVN